MNVAGGGVRVSEARQRYLTLKAQHPDAIVMFRIGDFYEMFDRDAEIAAESLCIPLTARTYPGGVGRLLMAGVPASSVQEHAQRLEDAGHKPVIIPTPRDSVRPSRVRTLSWDEPARGRHQLPGESP